MKPLALSDEQLTAVMRAAVPLPVTDRDAFLTQVAAALQDQSIGDCLVFRTVRESKPLKLVGVERLAERLLADQRAVGQLLLPVLEPRAAPHLRGSGAGPRHRGWPALRHLRVHLDRARACPPTRLVYPRAMTGGTDITRFNTAAGAPVSPRCLGETPPILQNSPKGRLRGQTHSSIRIQEGDLALFAVRRMPSQPRPACRRLPITQGR